MANKNPWIWQTPSSNYKPQKTYNDPGGDDCIFHNTLGDQKGAGSIGSSSNHHFSDVQGLFNFGRVDSIYAPVDGNGWKWPECMRLIWCCMERCFHIMSWYMMLIMLSITHVHRVSSQKLPQIIWKNLEFLGWTDLRFPQVYQHIIFIWGYECYDPLVTNSPTTHTSFGKLNPSS